MNLEIFNLLGNETKNFVSSFVNELAKALDKGNNMNIGVVYGLDNEKITLLNPENGKEEEAKIKKKRLVRSLQRDFRKEIEI